MSQVLRQGWWAPLAALLALALFILAFIIGFFDSDDDTAAVIIGVILALAGALVLAAGLWKRPQARGLGNALIILGCLLAAFWLWTVVLPIAAIIVVAGVISSEVRAPRRTAEASTDPAA
jgi:peptidoglycan/LPS O-acetylase OafA/YrhL